MQHTIEPGTPGNRTPFCKQKSQHQRQRSNTIVGIYRLEQNKKTNSPIHLHFQFILFIRQFAIHLH